MIPCKTSLSIAGDVQIFELLSVSTLLPFEWESSLR